MEEEIADEKQENENNSNDDIKDSIKLEQNNAEEASNDTAEGEDSKDIKYETNEAAETKPDTKNESSSSTFDPTELVKEPIFAEICSFFNMFAAYLNMKPLSFVKLEKMFCTNDDEEVSHDLIDLHLTLLRKIGYKSARFDKWESFLQKFLLFNKDEEKSVQLERLGYANLPLTTKLEVLFQLCGRQFDFNIKFKENIFNTLSPFELRLATIGKDRNGLSYWYQRDHDLNVRVYTEEPEDESGSTWSLIARSHNDIIKLITSLKRTDFGQTKDDNDEDVDESQILDCSTDSKKSQTNGTKKKGEELLSPNFWKLLKPEVAEKYYKYLAKRNTFKDVYRDGSDLNKRKNEKLQKKEAKANGTTAATSSQTPAAAASTPKIVKAKSEEKEEEKEEEEEPGIPPELLEDRRILPRRSARSNAITSIKSITSTPARKKAAAAAVVAPVEEKKKEESEEESSDNGDEVDEDEEESDRSFGRSDEEFSLPSKKGKSGKATKKPRKQRPDNDDGDTPPKPKKKKKKVETIAFEESSDEEEEQQEVKEKRKATALTLCIHCHKSTKQDVLLLCDMCDDACHTFCLKPPLHYVPDDDWFCPQCHHAMLVDRLVKVEEELKDALKVKEAEDSKKMQAAERLKREMEYIGVSLNNIIPSSNAIKQDPYQSMTESTESEDDGQRKSKKKAMKKVMKHTRKKEREQYYGPVITVAEGRSRRSTKKVDYNFSAYDEQLQEAMDVIDEPGVKTKYENDNRPAGGLGRGKDMATIEDAQRKRSNDSEDFEDENDEPVKKKKKQKSKKLTDLDIDNATESEDDEYRASENEEEDAEPSEDDYIPSDIERQSKRRGRQRSDAEFIDDDESDEEYNPSGRKKKGKQVLRRSGGRKKRKAWDSDEEESEPEYQDESSDDGYHKKRKKAAAPPPKKRSKKDYSDEEEDEEVEDYQGESSDSGPKKKTARGRPMRKAAAKAVLKESDDEELGELDDAEEGTANDKKKNESRPIGALSRKLEEDEFKPDEDDEEEEGEEEEEEAEAEVDENDDEMEEGESDEAPDTGEEDEESRPPKIRLLKRKAPTPPPATAKKSPSKIKKGNKIAESPKEEKPTIEPKKEISPPVKAAAPASNPPSSSSTPKPAPTPPRQQILVGPNPQQASHLIQPQQSSPGPNPMHIRPPLPLNGFIPYSTAMPIQQHPNAIRFIQPPHSLYGAPAGGYYGPPPMNYGPPPMSQHLPILPTYVMQNVQPPQYGMPPQSHGFLSSNLTMLEPLQPMHHIPSSHHQQSNNMYGGLQPIQHSQPSDSDGLAQAIAGAMNSEL